jgi:hypothetical protein
VTGSGVYVNTSGAMSIQMATPTGSTFMVAEPDRMA